MFANPIRSLVVMLALSVAVLGCKKKDKDKEKKVTKPPATKPKADTPKPKPKADTPKPKTDDKIHGEEVTYKSGDVELKGYLAYDKTQKGPRPGVLVVHEWWGHNDYARSRARQLASMGYTALAVDMYGGGKQAKHPDDAKKFMMEVVSNMPEGKKRFDAAKKLLEAHDTTDPKKTSAIGYCFGGAVVLHMARFGSDLDLVASFHGNLGTKAPAKKGAIKAQVLVLHGEADPFIKPESVAAFKKEMKEAGAKMTFVGYPGAKHAFTNPGATELGTKFKLPLAYDKDADTKSWAELEKALSAVYSKSP